MEKKDNKKRIVVPGELLTDKKKKLGSNVFVRDEKVYSTAVGLLSESDDFVSVVALEGAYLPKLGDLIVGVVTSEKHAGYIADINSLFQSFVLKTELRDRLKVGTVISAKVTKVNELHEADLGYVRVFYGGELIKVSPVKVPRIIGKNNSMLNVIRDQTQCNLMIGRNGMIWLNGGRTDLATEAIRKIEKESHLSNLTNRIAEFLKEATKQKVEAKEVK